MTTHDRRRILTRAIVPPPEREPITPEKLAWLWRFALLVGIAAIAIDLGLAGALARDPAVDRRVLWIFEAINLPILAATVAVALWQRGRPGGTRMIAPLVIASQLTVIVWVQVTGTLSSYFVVTGAMLIATHRALLSWRYGLYSLIAIWLLHETAFLLEEAHVLPHAPLFVRGPGPIYDSAQLRWSVMASLSAVYALTWAGANLMMAMVRDTERALASAERRLAEVAEGARHGRMTGRRLDGRWRMLEVIGRGGMGEVYRARADAGDEVAIKVMHPHLAEDEIMLARFRREADVASRVPAKVGPALIDVRLAGPIDRYLVMEYLRGEDLAALLRRRGRVPPAEAIALVDAAARAVAELHALGIVHRDLKPHNLFVVDAGPPPEIRILDFGIARTEHDVELTSAAQIVGTPGYIAPEHFVDGRARLGPPADVFALAVIAFQLLTGQRPFPATERGATPVDPIAATTIDPSLPPEIDLVFALALARSPARRPAIGELAPLLAQAIEGALPERVRAIAERLRSAPLTAHEDTELAERPASSEV